MKNQTSLIRISWLTLRINYKAKMSKFRVKLNKEALVTVPKLLIKMTSRP